MKRIFLTNGGSTLVDDEDYEFLRQFTWNRFDSQYGSSYARRSQNPKRRMHQLLMTPTKGWEVDHINHDTLDNRKENLRVVTRAQNQQNRIRARPDSKTGVRGVFWSEQKKKYQAYLNVNGKRIYAGVFSTLVEAEAAAVAARAQHMTHADGR